MAAARSSKEAWALYERIIQEVNVPSKSKSDEIKRGKGKGVFTPTFTWKSSGSFAMLSSNETDKERDLEPRVLPVTFDETFVAPSVETAWCREEV